MLDEFRYQLVPPHDFGLLNREGGEARRGLFPCPRSVSADDDGTDVVHHGKGFRGLLKGHHDHGLVVPRVPCFENPDYGDVGAAMEPSNPWESMETVSPTFTFRFFARVSPMMMFFPSSGNKVPASLLYRFVKGAYLLFPLGFHGLDKRPVGAVAV